MAILHVRLTEWAINAFIMQFQAITELVPARFRLFHSRPPQGNSNGSNYGLVLTTSVAGSTFCYSNQTSHLAY